MPESLSQAQAEALNLSTKRAGGLAGESDYVSHPFTSITTELTDGLGKEAVESDTRNRGKDPA